MKRTVSQLVRNSQPSSAERIALWPAAVGVVELNPMRVIFVADALG